MVCFDQLSASSSRNIAFIADRPLKVRLNMEGLFQPMHLIIAVYPGRFLWADSRGLCGMETIEKWKPLGSNPKLACKSLNEHNVRGRICSSRVYQFDLNSTIS
jgi:hypothetical protein